MTTCQYHTIDPDEPCDNLCEGSTMFCGSHNSRLRKQKKAAKKFEAKRKEHFAKKSVPRKIPSKNPKDWNNTFLCSDGRRVTQAEINNRLSKIYSACDKEENRNGGKTYCRGCGGLAESHAHIIPQARCKQIGKTELIWQMNNWFYGCFECNSAIENPKGTAWKKLKNIDKCIAFIYEHDKELYFKFEAQGWQAKKAEGQII